MPKLFTDGKDNTKTAKSSGKGYSTLILHLAPGNESGHQVCQSASKGCLAACLFSAGRGVMAPVKAGRIRKTKLWFENKTIFKLQVIRELLAFQRRCKRNGTLPAVRMNGTSDIVWERAWPQLFKLFPTIQFYCYTKHQKRCVSGYELPSNYHLTFSRSESNDDHCEQVLSDGNHNVAVVFNTRDFPTTYKGFPVFDADNDDLRFLDNNGNGGRVAALYAKGQAKKDESGFVILT